MIKRKKWRKYVVGDYVKCDAGAAVVQKRFYNHPRQFVHADGYHYTLSFDDGRVQAGFKSDDLLLLTGAKRYRKLLAAEKRERDEQADMGKGPTNGNARTSEGMTQEKE